MKPLTPRMLAVLNQLNNCGRANAATLNATEATMEALATRGLVNAYGMDEQAWRYPRTRISWGLNATALQYVTVKQ